MKINKLLLLVGLLFSTQLIHATQCVLTVLKDSCWESYQVKVQFFDKKNNNFLTSLTIPAMQNWARVKFNCSPGQVLAASASFLPSIYAGETNKSYSSVRFWNLPNVEPEVGAIWTLEICFGSDFANLPFPPKATNNCQCNPSDAPAVQNN
jgi:hypothetical protein